MKVCSECNHYGWNGDDHGRCHILNCYIAGNEEACDDFEAEVAE